MLKDGKKTQLEKYDRKARGDDEEECTAYMKFTIDDLNNKNYTCAVLKVELKIHRLKRSMTEGSFRNTTLI